MKDLDVTLLNDNVDLQVPVPSDYAELDSLLGGPGAGLDDAIRNIIYRNKAPRIYASVAAQYESERAKTGEKEKKDKDGKVIGKTDIYEADIPFLTRLYDAGPKEKTEEIATKLREAARTLPFYAAGERGGGGRIAQGDLDAANGFAAKGPDVMEKVAGAIESTVPGYKVSRAADGSIDVETLARGISALNKHLAQKAKKDALAMMGV